ncbi:MAG: GNAT family N-acetyltransferase [Candidatus Sumerlaeia bacterium]|nr:GNAT family N-acetyltransferase [Candidatus Sumerlaeia bacterium]
MPDTFLKTNRLYLRKFTANDLLLLMDLDSDPEVLAYLNPGSLPNEAYLRDTILPRWITWYEQYSDLGFWAAHESSAGDFIGWFHLRPTKEPETAELGYRLKRSAWGKGYATEMSRALVALGFRRPDIHQIEATSMAANKASIRVMEKVGLRFVEHYTEHTFPGEDKRAVRYRITREQFEESATAVSHIENG